MTAQLAPHLLRPGAMRILPGLCLPVLLVACSGGDDPAGATSPTKIRVATTVLPPELVVFREGVTGSWQPATRITATTFELVVQHPYEIGVVCRESSNDVRLWQIARTPHDAPDVSVRCGSLDDRQLVTGHMVQAGQLTLGDGATISQRPEWDFFFDAEPGTYDLVARTDAQIAIRRGIVVGNADVALAPVVDLTRDATAFATVAFSAGNAAPDEALSAVAYLQNPTLVLAADLPVSPLDAVKLAPDSVLTPIDTQTVEVRARRGAMVRSLRRPFRVGGDTTYTLPAAIGNLQWALDATQQLSVSWSSMPELDELSIVAFSGPSSGVRPLYQLWASADFLAATGIQQIGFDTDLPGYRDAWKIDFARGYQRLLQATRVQGSAIATTSADETIAATPAVTDAAR